MTLHNLPCRLPSAGLVLTLTSTSLSRLSRLSLASLDLFDASRAVVERPPRLRPRDDLATRP